MSIRCGIDLGTTYSAISWYDAYNQRVETVDLEHADGRAILPSVVYFEAGGNVVVGETAQNAALQHPDRVIIGIKRSMGDDYTTLPIDGKEYTPQEVSTEILKVLKEDAELYMGDELVTDVVLSVPAYFNERQRLATQEAAELAGLKVLELFPEPHAAALGFAIHRIKDVENRNLIVYDLGGGTFDVTLITTEREDLGAGMTGLRFEMFTTEGNQQLGGLDWDHALARLVADKAMDEHSIDDPHLDAKAEATLMNNVERAKRQLSRLASLMVLADLQGNQVEVTRGEFEREASHLVLMAEALLKNVLEEAEKSLGLLTEKRIQELEAEGRPRAEMEDKKVRLLLCGGSTRMPMVKESVTRVMGEPPLHHKNPELLVTQGAAYRAYLLEERVEKESPKDRSTTSQQPREPSVPKGLTAQEVIDMFEGLNLPVTDNRLIIEVKRKELQKRYLREKGSTDGQRRVKADLWFKNADLLQKDRPALLAIVRDHFTHLADLALAAAISAGFKKFTQQLRDQLERFAREQCRCDPPLARRLVEEYLKERAVLHVGHPLFHPKDILLTIRFEPGRGKDAQVIWVADVLGRYDSKLPLPYDKDTLPVVIKALDAVQWPDEYADERPHFDEDERRLLSRANLWEDDHVAHDIHFCVGTQLCNTLKKDREADKALTVVHSKAIADEITLSYLLRFTQRTLHLAALPWELLWDDFGPFLLKDGKFGSFVRYLDLPRPPRPPRPLSRPLHILVLAPKAGIPERIRDTEKAARESAFAELESKNLVEVKELSPVTPDALANYLSNEERVDIVHFFGHGRYENGKGALLFDTPQGGEAWQSAQQLAISLQDAQLVTLLACQSARSDAGFSTGVATALSVMGVPMVVAMQFRIRIEAATRFTKFVYDALANGESVQRAVQEGRLALYAKESDGASWYVPTLTMRTRDPGPVYLVENPKKSWSFTSP